MVNYAIGIDLGTTNSRAAILPKGNIWDVEIISDDCGNWAIPSVVAFNSEQVLIGNDAKWWQQVASNARNTIFDVKRLLGVQHLEDAAVQKHRSNWPLNKLVMKGGPTGMKVVFEVEYRGKIQHFTPEQITAMILGKLKEAAENYLQKRRYPSVVTTINQAVIAVPTYFDVARRMAIIEAADLAGLQVLDFIDEPIAAALAHSFDQKQLVKNGQEKRENVLVFDMGGGSLDVSVLNVTKSNDNNDEGTNNIQVIATAGNRTSLGGEQFTTRLVKHVTEKFIEKHNWAGSLRSNCLAQHHLRHIYEAAKQKLAYDWQTEVGVVKQFFKKTNLYGDTLSREHFEKLTIDLLFTATQETVGEALASAKLDRSQIDEVLLVGEATQMPAIKELLLEDYFEGGVRLVNGRTDVDPGDEVVYGAALKAAAAFADRNEQ